MADFRQQAIAEHHALLQEWNKRPANLQKVGQWLEKLKVTLTQLAFLPTTDAAPADSARVKQDLVIARDVLEIGALWSVYSQNVLSFERYMAQLKHYYFDYQNELPQSAFKHQLLGLNLLALLSQNRVAEFHTELELLSGEEIRDNVYIKHPVSLDQWLMEGCYNKVFLSKGNVPAESYNYFMDILLKTIRAEIAVCVESAYEKLSVEEAARILFLSSPNDVLLFAKSEDKNWTVQGKTLIFNTLEKRARENAQHKIPSQQLAGQAIEYAKELEMIV